MPLSHYFEEQDGGGRCRIQGLDLSGHGDVYAFVCQPPPAGAGAFRLAANQQCQWSAEISLGVGLPLARRRQVDVQLLPLYQFGDLLPIQALNGQSEVSAHPGS